MNQELYEKIIAKKEFSQLPRKDVLMVLEKFEKKNLNDWQMIKLARQFLRKIYSSFSSRKVFSMKNRDAEWYLMKHKSTKERFPYYDEIYERIFPKHGKFSIIDLGAGINGLSFLLPPNSHPTRDPAYLRVTSRSHSPTLKNQIINLQNFLSKRIINYLGIEAIGQFVELMNEFFKKYKMKNMTALHLSMFELEKVKEIIKEQEKPRIVLMFKIIDSLELVKRDYSKELLREISPLCDRIVVSFATRSLGARKKFSAQRNWLVNFIKKNFKILDDFEIGGERYIVFKKIIAVQKSSEHG